jgi:ABC-type lipoprotein export system ATPase subunit
VSLLSVESVSKGYRRGGRERVALRDVSMTLTSGEFALILGTRRSGRSTLMRIAAGLERPDRGRVTFDGVDLRQSKRVLGRRISYCLTSFSTMEGDRVVDHVAAPLLAQRMQRSAARQAAEQALRRVGAERCAMMTPDELDWSERVRVAIARGLAPEPALLVVDDPTARADALQRDPVLRLLREITRDGGPSVLMSTDDGMCVTGSERVLLLDNGVLRAQIEAPEAEVVSLEARRAGA